jgi:hypothetical protein
MLDAAYIVRVLLGEQEITKADVDTAAAQAETPSEDQIEAGNYQKGHIWMHGFDISIENAKGSERSGVNKAGEEWSVTMPAHYGYIKGTKGKDKDHLDVYIGPKPESKDVFVINQGNENNSDFDEHKIMFGFDSKESAIKTYDAAFTGDLGSKLRMSVVPSSIAQFKDWVEHGDTKKPFK